MLSSIATRKRFWIATFIGIIILLYTIKQANLYKFAQNLGNISPFWVIEGFGKKRNLETGHKSD